MQLDPVERAGNRTPIPHFPFPTVRNWRCTSLAGEWWLAARAERVRTCRRWDGGGWVGKWRQGLATAAPSPAQLPCVEKVPDIDEWMPVVETRWQIATVLGTYGTAAAAAAAATDVAFRETVVYVCAASSRGGKTERTHLRLVNWVENWVNSRSAALNNWPSRVQTRSVQNKDCIAIALASNGTWFIWWRETWKCGVTDRRWMTENELMLRPLKITLCFIAG